MPEILNKQNYSELSEEKKMSELLKKSITNASCEDRLKVGLIKCIDYLYSCEPNKILTVALTDSPYDTFSQKMLETYCYEQQIPFLKTDSCVLKRYLNKLKCNKSDDSNCCSSNNQQCEPYCCLIMKPDNYNNSYADELELVKLIQSFEMTNDKLVVLNSIASTPTPTSTVNPFLSMDESPS